jgi:hypothetical protein
MLAMLMWPLAGPAHAESNPFYVGADLSAVHDSNVFRLKKATSDTSYSVGLLAGLDQPIGRQRLFANGRLRETRFQDLSRLDHTSYAINAGLDWAAIDKLSGTLSFSGADGLFNYGGTNTAQSTERNIETRSESLARIRYGSGSHLAVEASLSHRSLRYSNPAYEASALTQDTAGMALYYQPSAGLKLGTGLRLSRGEYKGSGLDFDRRDIDLTATWLATGLSTLDGRFSVGRRESRGATSALDFSGATGQLIWTYRPTGKLLFKTAFSRESGAESSFLDVAEAQNGSVGDASRITNSLAVSAAYALSAKIHVDAGVRANHRSLVAGSIDGSDTLRAASLGVTYEPLRHLKFSCQVGRETRSTAGSLSFGYSASSATCTAEIKLQ